MQYSISTFTPAYQQAIAILNKHLDPVFLGEAKAADGCAKVVAELDPVLKAAAA